MNQVKEPITIDVDELIFRADLYPRLEKDPRTVQKYAEDLDVLPPININQNKEIIDGWHRWTAHRKNGAKSIKAIVVKTSGDANLLELAISANASHGLQLSQEDKKDMARRIYNATAEREREEKKKHLAKILSVSERTIRDWLSRIDKDTKEKRNKRIFASWLACHTQEEIAEQEGITKETVSEICQKMANLPESDKSLASHATDFDPPIYNVWKQQTKSQGVNHFGNTESSFVDNLLYLYTKPFDIVVDPFAGGGSTIDICKKRFRRYWVGDRIPIVERESEIRKHDIVDSLPPLPRWSDVRLVYLDPPYWWQSKGKYSNDAKDLGNMELDCFHDTLANLIKGFAKKLKNSESSYIALIISPTQWNAENKQFTDHMAEMLGRLKLPIEMRIQCPYESQQCTAQMVSWAKENKQLLVISREMVIWKV
jgi:transcriptional regulator with XRE-family HTH domain